MGRIKRGIDAALWRERAKGAIALSFSLVVAACSSGGGTGAPAASTPPATSSAAAPPPAAAASPSFKDKITNFFSGSSATSPQPVANAEPDFNCPYIEIRAGASTLTIPPPNGENNAMALKYQGTFVRGARECKVVAGQMVMRVGVEGRIIVGPAGGPGNVDVPLRIAVVHEETGASRTIVTKLVRIPVTVPPDSQNPSFTHIEEGLSFPMPSAAALDHYIVYIGFDPIGAAAQEKPQPKPPARNAKPKPQASAN